MMRKKRVLRYKKEDTYWDDIGKALCEVYAMYGIERAIFYLRTALGPRISISQINIISLSADMRVLTPVCSTNASCSVHREITPQGKKLRYLFPDSPVDDILVNNDISDDIKHFKQYFSEKGTCFVGQRGVLRIPFYTKDNMTYLIQFWSEKSLAFTSQCSAGIQRIIHFFSVYLYKEGFEFHEKVLQEQAAGIKSLGYDLLCRCNGLTDVLKKIMRVAPSTVPVLIIGETGVGKESVADALHELSERKTGPLIKVNCGAISENLMESILFGHEKGAFTSAVSMHNGYFEQAHNGTIFLDEISELPLSAQVKLLRVLDSHTFWRVGSSKIQHTNARLIFASNRNLEEMVRQGKFRQDLYYRLSVYPIFVPPLRERHEDILPVTEYLIKEIAAELGKSVSGTLTEHDISSFYQYSWPGNVRELKNTVERVMIDYISGNNLKDAFQSVHFTQQLQSARDSYQLPSSWPTLAELEQSYITAVLDHVHGKMTGNDSACSILGIHYTTLRSHLKKIMPK